MDKIKGTSGYYKPWLSGTHLNMDGYWLASPSGTSNVYLVYNNGAIESKNSGYGGIGVCPIVILP